MVLECDYLVVGTGVSGMAFTDVVAFHSKRTVIMVDKNAHPGGHWNQSYEFARLHQPAAFYGVASERLERSSSSSYQDLSSRNEILEYYRFVMDKLVKTGRVRHFGECTYDGDPSRSAGDRAVVHSFTDKQGISHQVGVKRRIVDATYVKSQIPATHPPRYSVEDGVECIPINGIYGINRGSWNKSNSKFVVIGAGKTGIDAVLYLLDSGIDPEKITWIMPRDSWLLNRSSIDPRKVPLSNKPFFDISDSLEESLLRREKEGLLLRLDTSVWPEKYSCATVDTAELAKLRLIRNVIRKGRVLSITKTHLVMTGKNCNQESDQQPELVPYRDDRGFPTSRVVFVDCSATATPIRPVVPIFRPGGIVIQPVRYCQIALSGAMVAYIDCHPGFRHDNDRNSVVVPVPFPSSSKDGLRAELLGNHNLLMLYGSDPRTRDFFKSCRLNLASHIGIATRIKLYSGALYHLLGQMAKSIETKKRQYRDEFDGHEFEYETYSPHRMRKAQRLALIISLCFYAVVFLLLTVLIHVIVSLKGE